MDDQLARPMLGPEWDLPPGPGMQRPRDEGIELSQLWGMVRDNARLVFGIAAVTFILVMSLCLMSRMTFKSMARLYLGELESSALAANRGNVDITSGNSSEAGSEIEVLRSRSMVRRAALAAGLNVQISPPGWKPPRYWRWLLSLRDPALLDVAASQLAATDTVLADDVIAKRNYKVKFLSPSEYVLRGVGEQPARGRLGEPLKTRELTITLLPGREGPKTGAQFDLAVEPLEVVVENALEKLDVTVPKSGTSTEQVRVLTLSFSSGSRLVSAAFLTELMRGYLGMRHAWKTEDASAAERFVTEQLASMQQSLDRTQEKLAKYRAENQVVVLASEAEAMAQQMSRFEQQRMEANLQASSLRALKKALRDPRAPIEAHMLGETSDTVLQQLATQLNQSRDRLGDIDRQYSGQAPELKRQQAQVRDQLAATRNYVDGKLARTEQQVAALTKVIDDIGAKLKTVPGAELRLAQIGRESDVYSRMYSYLLERQQQAAITKASTVSKNRILDPATIPLREDTPKLGLHLASGVLGLLLGAMLVIVRGLFSGVFRRENDVRVTLGPVQVFARIPMLLTRLRTRNGELWPSTPMFDVMASGSDPGYAEAFRALRTNLYRSLPGEHGKVVLVTSPATGDGKTTCALSLAAMLAADNRRVLVIDADVRKPSHHALLNVPQAPGLKELVTDGRGQWRASTHTVCLSAGWFDVVCAGSAPSAELLSDGQFGTFLVHSRSHYDFVVIDCASFPSVSDPLVLAPLSDFVLSVLRLGSTSRRLAEEHVSAVFTGARGYAVVVNSVEAAPGMARAPEVPANFSTAFKRLIR